MSLMKNWRLVAATTEQNGGDILLNQLTVEEAKDRGWELFDKGMEVFLIRTSDDGLEDREIFHLETTGKPTSISHFRMSELMSVAWLG
jgi:hypothetical protein